MPSVIKHTSKRFSWILISTRKTRSIYCYIKSTWILIIILYSKASLCSPSGIPIKFVKKVMEGVRSIFRRFNPKDKRKSIFHCDSIYHACIIGGVLKLQSIIDFTSGIHRVSIIVRYSTINSLFIYYKGSGGIVITFVMGNSTCGYIPPICYMLISTNIPEPRLWSYTIINIKGITCTCTRTYSIRCGL